MTAAGRWAAELAAWRIDDDILAGAPESPYGFPPELFRVQHDPTGTRSPLLDRAAEALPAGGQVLDVGVGAGAACVPLAPRAAHLIGVDSQPSMLEAFLAAAADAGVDASAVPGTWPAVAGLVGPADVVVCSHVFYNEARLGPFARALTDHARRRVVAELNAEHPWVDLGPLWAHFHGQPRPAGPTAELAVAVLREAGLDPQVQEWARPAPDRRGPLRPAYVAFTRRRLCLPREREAEVAALLDTLPTGPSRSVVLWWDV